MVFLLNNIANIIQLFRAGAGVAVIGPYLYVIGGFDDDSPLSTCEKYSFALDSWTEIQSLSCARGNYFIRILLLGD